MEDNQNKQKDVNKTEDTAVTKAESSTDKTKSDGKKPDQKNEKLKPVSKSGLGKLKGKMPVGPGNFWNNILSTVLFLVMLMAFYSYFAENQNEPEELSLSQIATQVKAGEVKEIVVRGSELEVYYKDETRNGGEAKKETDSSITETLSNLGVTTEQISAVSLNVQNPTGFSYWLGNLAPFIFPLIFLGIIIWFFTRSVKGTGMQALNFGNSKARMIDPDDTANKVTFKDVAGAKEAKQELEEIVDF